MKTFLLIVTITVLFCTTGCEKQEGLSDSIFFYPNNFTPNGDGNNDSWMPKGGIDMYTVFLLDSDTYLMKIFNKNDKLLFKTESINEGWDGNFNNIRCPYDYYYFIVTYKSIDGIKHRDAGMFELLMLEAR